MPSSGRDARRNPRFPLGSTNAASFPRAAPLRQQVHRCRQWFESCHSCWYSHTVPIDEKLAETIRDALMDVGEWKEVKMFGGIGFMLNGHLLAGASTRGLLLRVGKERTRAALAKPGTRPMVMRGRTMADYIYVDHPALNT